MRRRKKSLLKTHCHSFVDIDLTSKRDHRDIFNPNMKGCTTTPKEASHIVREMIQKLNKIS